MREMQNTTLVRPGVILKSQSSSPLTSTDPGAWADTTSVYLQGYAATGGNAGGIATLRGGAGGPTGAGGAARLTGGAGGSTSGDGGAVTIAGGAATTGNSNGGSVTLDAGAKTGTGVNGDVTIGGTNAVNLNLGRSAGKIGLFGATAVLQQDSTGNTATFAAGAATASKADSTWTGGLGASAYSVGDIVRALKNLGLMTQ